MRARGMGGTRSIDAGGATIATQSFGAPTNPAVVLNMGATASMLGWPDELCHALAERALIGIRYDNRDTGLPTMHPSEAPAYAVEDMAADLVAVLDAYDIGRAHVMGLSLGGLIGQVVTLSVPEPHGDHVLRHGFPQAHARIEALGHDVHEASFGDDVDRHGRIARQERRNHVAHQEAHPGIGGVDAQRPRGAVAKGVHLTKRVVQLA